MEEKFPRTGGCLRRLIDLKAHGSDIVVAWLEDDCHHFGVTIRHDGKKVTDVKGEAMRFPWSTCPGAQVPLREIIGMPLVERSTEIGAYTDMRSQCTHMFDLAGLAVAHAGNGRNHRAYEAIVPDREPIELGDGVSGAGGRSRPEVYRDGERVMYWELEGQDVVGPEKYAGLSLAQGFRVWTESLDIEEAEAATVLRRAVLVAGSRNMDLDVIPDAGFNARGSCFTFQPAKAPEGRRIIGNVMNYESGHEGMLINLDREKT